MAPRVDRWLFLFALFLVPASTLLAQTPAVHVVARTKIGGYIEDLDVVRTGRLANQIVAVTDAAIYAVPVDRPSAPRLVADLRHLPLVTISPRGIAWVESERRFALMQTGQVQQLVFTDETGADLGSRPIHYLNGFVPTHAEGLAYIPRGAAHYPDHLVTAAWAATGEPHRLEVIDRSGQVVTEIFPALGEGSLTSVAVTARGDRLLIGFERADPYSDAMYEIDFDGHVTAGPIPAQDFLEGIAQSPDGRIWTTVFDRVTAYDRAYNPRPADEKNFGVGLGLALPLGVGWSADAERHLVNVWRGELFDDGSQVRDIAAVTPAGDAASMLLAPGPHAPRTISEIADEHRIVIAVRGAQATVRGLQVFESNGAFVERVVLPQTLAPFGNLGQPNSVEYIPTTHQFAVRFTQQTSRIFFFDRHGAFVRTIDLAPLGTTSAGSYAFFNAADPSGGNLLVFAGGQGMVIDLNGALCASFDLRAALDLLGVADAAAIDPGAAGGTFSAVDTETGELVTFTLELP